MDDSHATRSLSARARARQFRAVLVYIVMVAAAVGVVLLVRAHGSTLTAPAHAVSAAAAPAPATPQPLLPVLVALAAIVLTGRLLGRFLGMLGQPPVIGDLLAGTLIGPSLLGRVMPGASAYVLPASAFPFVGVIGHLGLILYMFRIGIALDLDALRGRAHAAVAISHTSVVLPFVSGAVLALWLYPRVSTSDVSFTSFALFVGVAMSVTAFPVLARILTDNGLGSTRLGTIALTCAAVDDVTAWGLLALVVGIVQASVQGAALAVALTALFLVTMLRVVRPLVTRWIGSSERSPSSGGHDMYAVIFAGLLVCAAVSEAIGIHAAFGSFLFGAIVPREGAVTRALARSVEPVTLLLLPAYFAITGMRLRIDLVSDASGWLMCVAITVVAIAGKLGGTLMAARCTGLGWRAATALGILMNTRGLMELVVLNIGLEMGVLSPALFTMMVFMALATTIVTAPALRLLGLECFGPWARIEPRAPGRGLARGVPVPVGS
jgi:Kef-type K+ transport system membrane component KefB